MRYFLEEWQCISQIQMQTTEEYEKNDSGEFKVLPLAFYHNENRVSVNRKYDHNSVLKTQGDLSNGVVRLIAGYVRNMTDIYPFQAVVDHDPIEESQ